MRNATLPPTGHWGIAAFDSNMGHAKHIKHWKPCLGALKCCFGTYYRLLIYALCVILPTGQLGTPHYSQPATEEWMHLTALWGTWNTSNIENHLRGLDVYYLEILFNPDVCLIVETPNRPVRNAHYTQPATEDQWLYGAIGHIEHWKHGVYYFGTNNHLLIMCDTPNRPVRNTLSLPTGNWVMDSFDSTMGHIKHIKHWKPYRGALVLIFDNIIQPQCLSYRGDSQPAGEECPLLPTGHWGTAAFDSNMGHVKQVKHWKPSRGGLDV